jgi:hypothetical protein
MALDLTHDVPRSPFDQIDGIAWLPRVIDKARAYFAGTHGDYSPYPCPGDKGFLTYFRLDANALGEVIKGGASDDEIAAYVRAHTSRTAAETAAYAEAMLHPPGNPIVRLALFVMKRKLKSRFQARYPQRSFAEIDSFPKMLALDEGHPIPGF